MKILIIKSGAIGDIIMATPFLRAIRKRFPKARIDFVIGKWSSAVLKGNMNIDRYLEVDDKVFHSKNPFRALKLRSMIKREEYDLAFVLDVSWLAGLFVKSCSIPMQIGFDRNGEGWMHNIKVKYGPLKHAIDYYLDLAYAVGAEKEPRELDLFPDSKDKAKMKKLVKGLKKPFVGVIAGGAKNPGTGIVDTRRWRKDGFLEVVKKLKKKYTILLCGGPGDKELNEWILDNLDNKKNVVNLAGKTSIVQGAALYGLCKAVICNDSGPMHIAGASGTKVIALFGPTHPLRKAPPGSKWIWHDQKKYKDYYDVYYVPKFKETKTGPPKEGRFMEKITAAEILRAVN